MAMHSGRRSLEFKPQNWLLSWFRAFACSVLTDCVVGFIEVEFLLLTVISVTSENSSGITIASGVDGNSVRKEVIGVQVKNRLSSQFRAFTCFVLADCALDLLKLNSS